MDFNKLLLLVIGLAMTTGCQVPLGPGEGDDYLIGEKVKDISAMNSANGSARNHIAIYDKTVQRIHRFDLKHAKLEMTLLPHKPGEGHAVLYQQDGGFVIDLHESYVGVYNRKGELTVNPVQFAGKIISAAFQSRLGYLVVYDSRQNVGVLKFNSQGETVSKWVGGPLLDPGGINPPSVSAGDLDESGRLIVGLTDNSISVVDLDQSMSQGEWVHTNFATALTDIKWIAPVRGHADQILVRSDGQISLIDVGTHAVLSTLAVDDTEVLVKTSKVNDAHVILGDATGLKIVFAENSVLTSRTIVSPRRQLLSSVLNLEDKNWTFMDYPIESTDWESRDSGWRELNSPNDQKSDRTVHRYNLQTLRSWPDVDVPNSADVDFTSSHMFQLFPSKLGYARYQNMGTGKMQVIKMFNKDAI